MKTPLASRSRSPCSSRYQVKSEIVSGRLAKTNAEVLIHACCILGIYYYAFPVNSVIPLRADGLIRDRHLEGYTRYTAGSSMRFSPTPPALAATSQRLRKETFEYYYTSNTFLFSDVMFCPDVIAALEQAQPGMKMIKQAKVFHNPHVKISALRYGYERLTLRFTVVLDEQKKLAVSNMQAKAHSRSLLCYDGLKKGFCGCFVEQIGLDPSTDHAEDEGSLLRFLHRYEAELEG